MNIKNNSLSLLLILFITSVVVAQPKALESTLPLKFDTGNPAPYGLASTVITIQGKKLPIIFDTGAKKYELALTNNALKNIRCALRAIKLLHVQ